LESIYFDKIINELETGVAALSIGLSLGFIGAGGSILTIPVFVYILKKDPFPLSVFHVRCGNVDMAGSIQSFLISW
jgi:uncharacterized membrane protein YfcA